MSAGVAAHRDDSAGHLTLSRAKSNKTAGDMTAHAALGKRRIVIGASNQRMSWRKPAARRRRGGAEDEAGGRGARSR